MLSSTAISRFSRKSPERTTSCAIECRGVGKRFYYYEHRTKSVREWFVRSVLRQPIHIRRPVFTLTDFNLSVKRGESVALIGPNGSGKSTVLRLIAGIYEPTTGTVEAFGRLGVVMELGAGFHTELTGAENVELYSAVMGISRQKLAEHYDSIVDFAGIGDFIDTPIKYYSSGMQARLAFAVAVSADPDILLVDEVLAVGDQSFRSKCINRLQSFRRAGGTMLVVSHQLELVEKLCSRAVWLEGGETRMAGEVGPVLEAYRAAAGGAAR